MDKGIVSARVNTAPMSSFAQSLHLLSFTKHLHYTTWLISRSALGMIGIYTKQLAKSFVKSGFHYTSLAHGADQLVVVKVICVVGCESGQK